ncbi:type I-B CRISPR-associated protein Cas5 [Alteribacter lacisalsi]|uniref:Type I-B CRISPR-associated protein Cas5 n=1 Tax=Alteribacter lacisalsi TaxID=2045244 RepID=A0A2W0H448_9BACI|nr:type I-B CRISPR-associated protein Cas5b [Alteribacter lacisalsi]PYZ96613.1 type I-B CRISPR-associated protein Cas5 [Alteribacter lacisalsi]
MRALLFELTSEFGMLKRPDIRSGKGRHFTYNHIHKVAVLGIIGAVCGYEGYNIHSLRRRLGEEVTYFPEFYDKLKSLKVGIVPNVEYDSFTKDESNFTDTTNFSNSDGTLMVKEQWLRNPSWTIYILLDGSAEEDVENRIIDKFTNKKAVFIPYIGKNDHPATISEVVVSDLSIASSGKIDSLFELAEGIEEDILEQEDEMDYFLKEQLPVKLSKENGNYVHSQMAYTDAEINVERYVCGETGKQVMFV